jgi:hypothetical protein
MKDVSQALSPPTDWPSYLVVPTAGCWQFTITAERGGEPITGTITYIAVD